MDEFYDLYLDFNETFDDLMLNGTQQAYNASADDFHQIVIYNEMKEQNRLIETYRHIFGILGSLVSVIGIFGNLMSLIIFLRPETSNLKILSNKLIFKKQNISLNQKLHSFYTYLIALSFCDLFSCIFAVTNVLEYIHPPYIDHDSSKYREFCLYVAMYTHPFVLTLQALSIWIICAFSIHRCRSIIRPSSFLTKLKNQKKNSDFTYLKKFLALFCCCMEKNNEDHNDDRTHLGQMNIKNCCTNSNILVEFYMRSVSFMFNSQPTDFPLRWQYWFCTYSSDSKSNEFALNEETPIPVAAMTSQEYEYKTMYEKPKKAKVVPVKSEQASRITEARMTLGVLYFIGLLFLIPQFFEKKVIKVDVAGKEYMFLTITEFGRSRIFRQAFHLWFFTLGIYIVPLLLILIFNFLLLRAFLTSQKKCQPYKMNKDANQILRNMSSMEPSTLLTNEETSSTRMFSRQNSNCSIKGSENIPARFYEQDATSITNQTSFKFRQRQDAFKASLKRSKDKISKRNRALTLTLFGVVILFGVCHLPALISRILWVVHPEMEFRHNKNLLVSLFADISNFLVMLNSSVNFILYIVFGPGKFRQEFKNIANSVFGCFTKCSKKMSNILERSGSRRKESQIESDLYQLAMSSAVPVNSAKPESRSHFFNDGIEEESESV